MPRESLSNAERCQLYKTVNTVRPPAPNCQDHLLTRSVYGAAMGTLHAEDHRRAVSRVGALVLAAILVAVTCSACGSGGNKSGADQPLVLGALLPQTGDLASLGKATSTAVKLAVDQANAAGGVHGQKIDLVTGDSATDANIAQTAVQQMLTKRPDAIIGAISSSICLAVLSRTIQAQVPMISPACTTPQLTNYPDHGYFFRTAAPSDQEGPILAQIIHADHRGSVGVLAVNNSYGQTLANAFVPAFQKLGGKIAVRVNYDASGKDFSAEVQNVANTHPDAVVLIGYTDTGASIAHSAAQQGLLSTPWYVTDGIEAAGFPKQAVPSNPSLIYGWKGVGVGVPDSPAAASFAKAYRQKYNTAPPAFAAQAYDAAWLAILAADESKTSSGANIKAKLTTVSAGPGEACAAADCLKAAASGKDIAYQGASGEIAFNTHGDPGKPYFDIWTFTKGGIKSLKTIEGSVQ